MAVFDVTNDERFQPSEREKELEAFFATLSADDVLHLQQLEEMWREDELSELDEGRRLQLSETEWLRLMCTLTRHQFEAELSHWRDGTGWVSGHLVDDRDDDCERRLLPQEFETEPCAEASDEAGDEE